MFMIGLISKFPNLCHYNQWGSGATNWETQVQVFCSPVSQLGQEHPKHLLILA